MSLSNLPPGVSDSDIPGNRPQDQADEDLLNALHAVWAFGYTEDDVLRAWREVCQERESQESQEIVE